MKRMTNHKKLKNPKAVEAALSGPHAGQASIRKAYEALGVQDFYASHGARYTNPHEDQILAALWQLLDSTPAAVWLGLRELPTSAHPADGDGEGDEGSDDEGDGATCLTTNSSPSDAQHRVNEGPSAGPAAPTATVTAGTAPAAAEAAEQAEAAAAAAAAVTAGLHPPLPLRVLDLACGSGEVSAAITAWNHSRALASPTEPAAAVDAAASTEEMSSGCDCTTGAAPSSNPPYCTTGAAPSSNPPYPRPQHQHHHLRHQQGQRAQSGGTRGRSAITGSNVSGSVVLPYDLHITACDPYTGTAYTQRTGRSALPWSFEDIADGCLEDWQPPPAAAVAVAVAVAAPPWRLPGPAATAAAVTGHAPGPLKFDLVVCSFALHLCEPSRLYSTLTALSLAGRWLVVLAPHKRPVVTAEHGWALAAAWRRDRTHVRLYRSLRVLGPEAVEAEAVGAGLCI